MPPQEVLALRFNQQKDFFSCSIENVGIKVFCMEPLYEVCHLDFELTGSIKLCELYDRTNLFALVSGGQRPKFSDRVVMVLDAITKKYVAEYTFCNRVLNVLIRYNRLVAVQETRIDICTYATEVPTYKAPTLLHSINTYANPKGLCEITHNPTRESQYLVFPGSKVGSAQIVDLTNAKPGTSSAPVNLAAHSSEIVCLSLNNDGTLLATASATGTLLRIFEMSTKKLLMELRRGSEGAKIQCINFSKNSEFLCATSDRGTVHIFAIKDPDINQRSTLAQALSVLSKSQWSFTKFPVSLPAECTCLCAFGDHNSIYALCYDGTFFKYTFSTEGKCTREVFDNFLELPSTICDI